MATGLGLNMLRDGATDATPRETVSLPPASPRRLRSRGGSTSGHQVLRCTRPAASLHHRKASGPRQATSSAATRAPSTSACPGASVNRSGGRRPSRTTSQPPRTATTAAIGKAATAGSAQLRTASTAPAVSVASTACCWRDVRQAKGSPGSGRELADVFDEGGKLGIGGAFASHQPDPELIVLGFQQP